VKPNQVGTFTAKDAQRIANAVVAHERKGRSQRRKGYGNVQSRRPPVRLCKTSSAWSKGTTATLNVWEEGTPPNETQSSDLTLEGCVNKFADVQAGKWVMVAMGGTGSYYLIAAEC
jgi:hypothetical protein